MAKASDPLADLMKSANKKFNLTVGSLADVGTDVSAITTGNLAIDYAVGVGGLPFGRSVELYGPPSCGKTTTALQVAAALQKVIKAGGDPKRGIGPDDKILYLDYEYAMDKEYAASLGLDTEHESFLFTQPDTLEDGANFSLQAVETGRIRLVIFDSVAAMIPSAKAEAEIGKSLPAVHAKLMKDFTSNMNQVLARNNCLEILLNHEGEKMGMGSRPGAPPVITTPGGGAPKYFASVRIRYQRIRENKGTVIDPLSKEEVQMPTSTDVKVKVTKNKVSQPFREAVVRVRYGKGFDNFWTALQVLLANKQIMYGTGWFYFHNVEELGLAPEWMQRAATGTQRPFIRGEENVFAMGDEHPEWRQALIELAEKVVAENVKVLSTVVKTGEIEDEMDEDVDAMLEAGTSGNRVKI